jgi:hypothetical protein
MALGTCRCAYGLSSEGQPSAASADEAKPLDRYALAGLQLIAEIKSPSEPGQQ